MPFYEVIFETGVHSVANYEDDNEALRALEAHNTRAMKGEVGGPTGHAAERVKRVLKYDKHPAEVGENQNVEVNALKEQVGAVIDNAALGDEVSVPEVAAGIRNITSPLIMDNAPFESDYIMAESGELKGSWSGSGDSNA